MATYVVDIGDDAAEQPTHHDAIELARHFVLVGGVQRGRTDTTVDAATVYRYGAEPDKVVFAVWRDEDGIVYETTDRRRAREVHEMRIAVPRRRHVGPPDPFAALRHEARDRADGDQPEHAAELYDVLADAEEEAGWAVEAERDRVAAQRLRVAVWFAEQKPALEHVTWERVEPVKRGRSWTFYVTPWDPEPGERYAVQADRRGRMRFVPIPRGMFA